MTPPLTEVVDSDILPQSILSLFKELNEAIMSTAEDVRKIFRHLPDVFMPEKANGVSAIIQIELSGEGAGNWIVKIAEGKLEVGEGLADSPAMILQMAASDYVALSRGEVNPIALLKTGRVKFQGDMGLALKFQQMFNRP